MDPLHRDNAHSPTSSLSESSFSAITSIPSSDEPFEAVDGCSSEDEIVWTANGFSPEEDFILVPQSHPAPSGYVIPDSDAPAPSPPDPPHVAFSQLSVKDPLTPATATVTLPPHPGLHPRVNKSKHKYLSCKRRMSAGGRSDVTGQALVSTVPAPRAHRGRRRRGSRDASALYPSPSPSPSRELAEDTSLSIEDDVDKEEKRGFGARPFVEDSDDDPEPVVKGYEDAVCYITSFLSNPSAALSCSSYTRLIFLQSLIIELGLISPASAEVPSSLKAAKRLIKTRAFVNIGEYLSVREQGPDKLREIMFSSKRELTSDLRRKGANKTNKMWVKRHGLNVLLVSIF